MLVRKRRKKKLNLSYLLKEMVGGQRNSLIWQRGSFWTQLILTVPIIKFMKACFRNLLFSKKSCYNYMFWMNLKVATRVDTKYVSTKNLGMKATSRIYGQYHTAPLSHHSFISCLFYSLYITQVLVSCSYWVRVLVV